MDLAEWKVGERCRKVQLPEQMIDKIRDLILDEMKVHRVEAERDQKTQTKRIRRLKDEQAKLLQAHLADAVPVDLMKSEQKRIGRELGEAQTRVDASSLKFNQVEKNLIQALKFASQIGDAYAAAGDTVRRQLNQALFDKIYLDDADDDSGTTHVLAEPFELLLSDGISEAARTRGENRHTPQRH